MAQIQVQQQNVAVAAGGGSVPLVPISLYVGDLDFTVTDAQLYDFFAQIGHVVSVRICRDATTRRSLGYGYVNYSRAEDAARAIDILNFTPLNGKPIRIMYSHRDPSARKSGTANIFIKNLDKEIDHKLLYDTFASFGNILSCKVATDPSGQSKGYGFVQFDSGESAQTAIDTLNGMLMNDKQVYVGHFLRKQEREPSTHIEKFNNVYVKNLAGSTTEDDLKKIFGEHGEITSVVVMKDGDGKSKCFGFVNFENQDDAARAVDALNGKKFDEKEWYVGKAQKKYERELEMKGKFEQNMKEIADKYQDLNLYVKNLDESIDDNALRELFSEFGTITSSKVMRDPSGLSRGTGFVAFSTSDEALDAIAKMNGKMIISKPLYVAHAQKKEDRRARLQAQFSQIRPVVATPISPRMPMYPPGAHGMGQQLFYGQPPSSVIPPQAGFGYHPQLMPGMRPGGAPMQNFRMPMVPQGQMPSGRRGGPIQTQQAMPLMQQQNYPRGRVYRNPPGRNVPDGPTTGGILSAPSTRNAPVSMQGAALAISLTNATLEQQRTILGENLYPLVDQLQHGYAGKITGMLLEMDKTEILHLIESPEALTAKVDEAMEVLQTAPQHGNPAEQLAAMSLNDNHAS